MVHYHFASLHALLVEAAVGTIRDLVSDLASVLRDASRPDELVDLLLGSLDQFSGRDPLSLLISETFLAATRDREVRHRLAEVLAGLRHQLVRALAAGGVPEPEATAAALAAAVDGIMLHRAVDPGITSGRMAPVIRRMLTTGGAPT